MDLYNSTNNLDLEYDQLKKDTMNETESLKKELKSLIQEFRKRYPILEGSEELVISPEIQKTWLLKNGNKDK